MEHHPWLELRLYSFRNVGRQSLPPGRGQTEADVIAIGSLEIDFIANLPKPDGCRAGDIVGTSAGADVLEKEAQCLFDCIPKPLNGCSRLPDDGRAHHRC